MLNPKEITFSLVAVLVLTLAFSFLESIEKHLITLIAVFLVVLINVFSKKIASFYLDSEINIKLWEIDRYGFRPHRFLKRPFPAGIFFPIIFSILTLGNFVWMASLVFEIKPKIHRARKRHGLYTFSEITEDHIGFIAAAGIIANLVFAIIGYLIGFSEFSTISIFFVFFNMLPFSDLDGNKIFFGSIRLWAFLATIVAIGLGYTFFLV